MIALLVAAQVLGVPITLDEVRAAAHDNLQALQAELDVVRAEAGIKLSRSAILPQLSGQAQVGAALYGPSRSAFPQVNPDGTISNETPGFTRGNWQLGLSLSQLIYDGGRWWNQLALSGAQADASRGQLLEQQLVSQLEAERRFFELLRSQQALAVLKQTVDRSRSQLERARALFEAGRGPKRDALDAEVNLGNDEIQVLRAQQTNVSAQVDLLSWLARPSIQIEAVAPASLEGPPLAGPSTADALALAREHRPLLKALEHQQRAARLGVDVARAAYFPRVFGLIGYSRTAPSPDPFFTDPIKQNALTFGLNLQWDIFSGFATQAQVGRLAADVSAAGLQLAQAERDLEAELRRASSSLETGVQIAALAEKNRAVAELALHLAEERFNAGASTTLEVRDAQIKLTQTLLTQLQGRIDVELARASLGRIVGAPLR